MEIGNGTLENWNDEQLEWDVSIQENLSFLMFWNYDLWLGRKFLYIYKMLKNAEIVGYLKFGIWNMALWKIVNMKMEVEVKRLLLWIKIRGWYAVFE